MPTPLTPERPMTPTPDDVRAAVAFAKAWAEADPGGKSLALAHAKILGVFADAVLNPPTHVAYAIENRHNSPEFDRIIADWIADLITPAAKETTK